VSHRILRLRRSGHCDQNDKASGDAHGGNMPPGLGGGLALYQAAARLLNVSSSAGISPIGRGGLNR
jgi:hypothetical protein